MTLGHIIGLPGFLEGEFGITYPGLGGEVRIDPDCSEGLIYMDDEGYLKPVITFAPKISEIRRKNWRIARPGK